MSKLDRHTGHRDHKVTVANVPGCELVGGTKLFTIYHGSMTALWQHYYSIPPCMEATYGSFVIRAYECTQLCTYISSVNV